MRVVKFMGSVESKGGGMEGGRKPHASKGPLDTSWWGSYCLAGAAGTRQLSTFSPTAWSRGESLIESDSNMSVAGKI